MTDIGQPPIANAKVLNPFSIQDYAIEKRIILDVRVEDEAGTFYNVEVQKAPETDFVERMLFGWAETYGSQLLRGENTTHCVRYGALSLRSFRYSRC